jgi:hypothetical protein
MRYKFNVENMDDDMVAEEMEESKDREDDMSEEEESEQFEDRADTEQYEYDLQDEEEYLSQQHPSQPSKPPGSSFNAPEEFAPSKSDLIECIVCSRTFNSDRIQKHEASCAKSSQPRKKFDTQGQRKTEQSGTKTFSRPTPTKVPTKASAKEGKDPKWKRQHDELQNAIKVSKKM